MLSAEAEEKVCLVKTTTDHVQFSTTEQENTDISEQSQNNEVQRYASSIQNQLSWKADLLKWMHCQGSDGLLMER